MFWVSNALLEYFLQLIQNVDLQQLQQHVDTVKTWLQQARPDLKDFPMEGVLVAKLFTPSEKEVAEAVKKTGFLYLGKETGANITISKQ
jgi:hypothetical protein